MADTSSTLLTARQMVLGLICALSFTLAACGFTPVYKMQGGQITLASVKVNGPAAQNLRSALEGRYQLSDTAPYRLIIDSTLARQKRQVDRDGVAERIEIGLNLRVQLRDKENGKAQSFSLNETQTIARQDSGADQLRDEEIVLQLISEQIAEQLVLQLSQRIGGNRQ